MAHEELPLPDYDYLPVGSLQSRIRTLDAEGVDRLLDYEREHANRLAVLRLLEMRAEALAEGAEPTGGSPQAFAPEAGARTAQAQEAAVTPGPPVNPPSHGDPTNPAQPRG